MTINWQPIIESAVSAAITIGIPLLAAMLTGLISSWRASLAVKADDAWYVAAGRMVEDAVLATGQVLVDDAKAASADGKLSEDEKNKALAHAMSVARSMIGDIPATIKPRFEAWLRAEVEAAVGKLKLMKAAQQPTQLPTSGGVQTAAVAPSASR
jgi:hypothetical protein